MPDTWKRATWRGYFMADYFASPYSYCPQASETRCNPTFQAVLASLIALYVVSRERLTPLRLAAGSLLMGTGIATMHYTGMAAMRLAAMPHYQRGLWILSIILAIGISLVGLLLISYLRDETHGWMPKAATAVIMGLAIPVMHYTGMAAVSFIRTDVAPDLTRSVDISALASSAILVVEAALSRLDAVIHAVGE